MKNATKTEERARYDRAVTARIMEELGKRDMYAGHAADMAGIPRSTLSNYMRGKSSPSLYAVARLCAALGLDANRVLGIRR